MLKLMKNEYIKMIHRPKNLVIFLIFFVICSLFAVANYRSANNTGIFSMIPTDKTIVIERFKNGDVTSYLNREESVKYYEIQSNIEKVKRQNGIEISDYNKLKKETNIQAKDIIETAKERILKEMDQPNYEINKTKELYQNDINEIEMNSKGEKRKDFESKNNYDGNGNLIGSKHFTAEEAINLYQAKIDNNENLNDQRKFTSINYLSEIFENAWIFLLLALLFGADLANSEANPETQKILLINPVKRYKIILSKYLVSILTYSIGITLILSAFTLGIGLIFGFGDIGRLVYFDAGSQYGYLHQATSHLSNNSQIVTLLTAIVFRYIQFILYSATAISLGLIFSVILKNNATSLIFSVVVFVVNMVLGGGFRSVNLYNTAYNFIWTLSNRIYYEGNLFNLSADLKYISYRYTLILYIVTAIINVIIACVLYSRKDIKH